jgi:ribosomal 50S subunit-recycling heat shock protein
MIIEPCKRGELHPHLSEVRGGDVRLDLFLKVSRLVKRRSLAKGACEGGRIKVDGRTAKASHQVRPGERIKISSPTMVVEVEIIEVPHGNVSRSRARELYRVLSQEKTDEFTWQPSEIPDQ